jgi:urocanate hydratase
MLLGHISPLEYPELAAVYDRFAALQFLSQNSDSPALFHSYLNRDGVALSIAANVAGIGSFCFEPEACLARQAMRTGICAFQTGELEEALRILKNEVRKGRAVSVAVTGEPEIVAAEALASGIQPEVIHLWQEDSSASIVEVPGVEALIARGARRLVVNEPDRRMISVHWSVAREPQRWLPMADALAVEALDVAEPTAPLRRRWLEDSPGHLGRHYVAQRYLPMTPAEADAFFNAVQRDVEGGEIQVAVSVVRNGEEELVLS